MHSAIDLHETGATPDEFRVHQERIRNEPDVMRAINHVKVADALTGGSFGDWVVRGKHWLGGTLQHAQEIAHSPLKNKQQKLQHTLRVAFNRPYAEQTEYSPSTKKLLARIGQFEIQTVSVCRTPIEGMISKAKTLQKQGKWGGDYGKFPHDHLFHLYLLVNLVSGQHLIIEKGPWVMIGLNSAKYKKRKAVCIRIPMTKHITLNNFLLKGEIGLGSRTFFSHNPHNNSNQVFINGILSANAREGNLEYPMSAKSLVAQNTEESLSSVPAISRDHVASVLSGAKKLKRGLKGGGFDDFVHHGIGAAVHLLGLKPGVQQPNTEDAPIHADAHALYPLTGLMSGTSEQRKQAVSDLSDGAVNFLQEGVRHVLDNPSAETEHPLVPHNVLQYFSDAADPESAKHRLAIGQEETGHGLLSDLATESDISSHLPSWINSNILHPLYHHVLEPAMQSLSVDEPTDTNPILAHPGGGVVEGAPDEEDNNVDEDNKDEAPVDPDYDPEAPILIGAGFFGDLLGSIF